MIRQAKSFTGNSKKLTLSTTSFAEGNTMTTFSKNLFCATMCLALATCVLLSAENTASALVVTDFSNFAESGNILSGSNSREQLFTPSGADVTITHVSGGGAGQEFYLSSEFPTLVAGDRISVDRVTNSSGTTTFESFGLGLANSTSVGGDQLLWFWRDDVDDIQLVSRTTSSGTGSEIVSLAAWPDTLFIERTATGWSFGSITGAVETIHFSDISQTPTNNTPITVDGSVIGLFSDMRSTTTPRTVTNFTVPDQSSATPEPSALILATFGLVGLVARRRRV